MAISKSMFMELPIGAQDIFLSGNIVPKEIIEERIKELTEKILLNPESTQLYQEIAKFYVHTKLSEAISNFDKHIEIYPDDINSYLIPARFLEQAGQYQHSQHYKYAIKYYTKLIELDPNNAAYYFCRANCSYWTSNNEEALKDYDNAIELDLNNPDYYAKRAETYNDIKNYDKALEDCNKAIELAPDKASLYSGRSDVYYNNKKYDNALQDVNKAIELNSNDGYFYFLRGKICFGMEDYDSALKNYSKAIQLRPYMHQYYLHRGKLFFLLKRYEDAINDLTECIMRSDDDCCEAYSFRKECYLEIKEYDQAREDADQEYSCYTLNGGYAYDPYETSAFKDIIAAKEVEEKQEQARVDEKNKIIADLSHSIKNLISTVIDPLEAMKKEHSDDSPVIENALKGANLIREIVNAMNCSFKGSIDDFYYDVKHNTGKEALTLQDIIVQSLTYSIGHMFDGKYFGTFLRKYFPEKSLYHEAKTAWIEKSQDVNLEEIQLIINQYFFSDIKLNITDTADLRIGNDKGSAIKLLILFQELIFNAVKYSAFVEKDKRFLHIHLTADSDQVIIKVENRYKKIVKVKTSGLGLVIIENFSKLLETEPMIDKDNDIYSVKIQFSNLWGKNIE